MWDAGGEGTYLVTISCKTAAFHGARVEVTLITKLEHRQAGVDVIEHGGGDASGPGAGSYCCWIAHSWHFGGTGCPHTAGENWKAESTWIRHEAGRMRVCKKKRCISHNQDPGSALHIWILAERCFSRSGLEGNKKDKDDSLINKNKLFNFAFLSSISKSWITTSSL